VRAAILILAAGCSFNPPGSNNPNQDAAASDGQEADAEIDAPSIDAQTCFGGAGYTICLDQQPTQPATLTGTFDTEDDPRCADPVPPTWLANPQDDACIVIATDITIEQGVTVDVDGDRPLVLLATGMIRIDGTLDAASHVADGDRGPGASFGGCITTGVNGATASNRGGGGAGGSFGSKGGDGGNGNAGTATRGLARDADQPPFDTLRAGCRGGTGAAGGDDPRAGGHGGGAVFLVAPTIAISGIVNASGAGGRGGDRDRGGGAGGGSGGMIVLDAVELVVPGTLIANGGGGGGGADSNNDGNDGGDPNPATPNTRALRGNRAGSNAGHGGAGAAGTSPAVAGDQGNDGGGGGGGGLGVIRVLSGQTLPTMRISPAPIN
jgi:hypothetical protein